MTPEQKRLVEEAMRTGDPRKLREAAGVLSEAADREEEARARAWRCHQATVVEMGRGW